DYLLDEKVEEIFPRIYSIGNEKQTIVYLEEQLSEEAYQWIISHHQSYQRVVIYDNSLSQSQKINLQGTLQEKLETV
ncbi:hypothetical protein, partial [Priestia megaterium]|uniref:hypothetical protein n=1 Tax=Priestia megaterium TaxID=1404 RepID=UPI003009CF9E